MKREEENIPRSLSPAKLAALKRKRDGAKTRMESRKKTAVAIKATLKEDHHTLSERRHLKKQLLVAQTALAKARVDYQVLDRDFRQAVGAVNNKMRRQLAGFRYQTTQLQKFESDFLPGVKLTLKNSFDENHPGALEAQLRLCDLVASDDRAQFNAELGKMFKNIDPKLWKKLSNTTTLRFKLNNALFEYFENRPDYLPQNSFEEDEARRLRERSSDEDLEGDTQ
jgi:hypothetical protein